MPTASDFADAILRDTLAAIPDGARQLTDADRESLRIAATLLAKATLAALAGDAPSAEEQLHLRAIRANLTATGHALANRALNDALAAALGRALSMLKGL